MNQITHAFTIQKVFEAVGNDGVVEIREVGVNTESHPDIAVCEDPEKLKKDLFLTQIM